MICNARHPLRIAHCDLPFRAQWVSKVRCAYTMLELVIVLAIIATLAAVSFPALMTPLTKSRAQEAAQDLSRVVLKTRVRAMETGCEHRLRWRPGTGEYEVTEVRQLVAERNLDAISSPNSSSTARNPSTTRRPIATPAAQQQNNSVQSEEPLKNRIAHAEEQRPTKPYRLHERLVANVRFKQKHQHFDQRLNQQKQTMQQLARANASPQQANNNQREQDSRAQDPRRNDGQQHGQQHGHQHGHQHGQQHGHQHGQHHFHLPWSQAITFYPDGRTDSAFWTLRSDDNYLIEVRLRGITGTVQVSSVRLAPPDPIDDPNRPDWERRKGENSDSLSSRSEARRSDNRFPNDRIPTGGERELP